jgi:hypothetical protein
MGLRKTTKYTPIASEISRISESLCWKLTQVPKLLISTTHPHHLLNTPTFCLLRKNINVSEKPGPLRFVFIGPNYTVSNQLPPHERKVVE